MGIFEMINKVRETVRKLFNEDKIDVFIGYGDGSLPLRTTPTFITSAEDMDRLVWNSFCSNNLAVFLPRFFVPQPRKEKPEWPKVGILANGCTGRSLVGLLKEKQVPRENIIIVGVPCSGMVTTRKIKDRNISKGVEKGNIIIIEDEKGKEKEINKEEILADVCVSCTYSKPAVYDILIEGVSKEASNPYTDASEFEKLSSSERWAAFEEEISKCIRCYACRTACPNCWCKECFAEQTSPRWIGITNNIADLMFYHLVRIFHQAGRCVDCGACVAACPVGIDLRKFTYKLVLDVKRLYGYESGISLEEPPPLSTYNLEDEQEFITEP
jgi:ferredoxin